MRKNISQIHHLHSSRAVGFGIVTYRAGSQFGPRRQGNFQFVVLHSGSATITVAGAERRLRKGQGILLEPGHEERFEFHPREESTHSWCQTPPELLPAFFRFAPGAIARPATCSAALLKTMQTGWKLPARSDEPEDVKARLASVLAAMWEFARPLAAQESGLATPASEPLVRVQRAVEEKLAEPWPLEELARIAGVSKGHLIKLAHQHWQTTPAERVWRLRLEESSRLLRETGLSVAEVAYRTGFANPFHFSRRFSAHFHASPRAWRVKAWGG